MRKSIAFFLCISSSVYAESKFLAPVIDRSTYPSDSSSHSAKPSNNAMYEIFGRLEQMQLELQQLRGLVEEQSQTISELDKRQNNIYSDLDIRLQELNGGSVGDGLELGESGQGRQPEETNGLVGGRNVIAAPATESMNNMSNTSEEVIADVAETEKELYQNAYEMLRNGHNTQAIEKFKQLLVKHPKGKFSSNSQYWLGEAYKVTNDINAAKRAFSKVVSHYGRSPKVPDAMLKLGYIELEQDNKVSARELLTQITLRYPDSTAAHLAKKKLLQMETLIP